MSTCGSTSGSRNVIEDDEQVQLRLGVNDPYIGVDELCRLEEICQLEDLGTDEEELGYDEEDLGSDEEEPTKPYVGMQFSSAEEAFIFYNAYAGRVGFSVRKSSKTRSRAGPSSQRFLCSKEEFCKNQKNFEMPIGSVSLDKSPQKVKSITRVGCKASLRVRRLKDGIWQVSVFVEEHNHALITSPSKMRGLRSQKSLSEEVVKMICDLNAQNVEPSKIVEYIASQSGGKQNLRFKKKDVSNKIAQENRKLVGRDVETTLIYFRKKQEVDKDFFYELDVDDDGVVRNLFWVDGRRRRSTWLAAMHGKHPTSIITDQDPAMRKAIEEVFPSTLHRCCQWHVMRKAREHLGILYGEKSGFKEELAAVINRSLTTNDFVDQWAAMIDRYKLGNVKHLKTMFATRHEWVPAYFRGTFFADMSTTQRSESMNAIFKNWVRSHTSIFQYVKRIENMIESIYQRESDEDLRSTNEIPHIKTQYVIEVEGRRVYTRSVFAVFRELVLESTIGSVREIEKDSKYEVVIRFHPFMKNWIPETYVIEVDIPSQRFSCNCKGFEYEGLLCSHAIKVMQHVGFLHLPDHYVLKRWTKDANVVSKNRTDDACLLEIDDSHQLKEHRITTLKHEFNKLAVIGSKSAESFARMKCRIDDLKGEFVEIASPEEDIPTDPDSDQITSKEDASEKVCDPYVSQCKGKRKKPTRFKPAAEVAVKKRRRCKVCSKIAGHNARTCPMALGNGDK
ncbi:Protein FAR1-RELATED SEQUENCE 5 [Rhynchospora pubera]|uniref:Protein FAR1-RELATED SEQUENCE 5 n=1 Tax=Rhynchospora pubera TaxID=906938 RepID=A0AAV8HQA1_9POAL|nr:Protein FAR1-RELATED SEQUENCE 5 [Rhynchospora pubera]